MSIFKPVMLSFKGKDYTVKSDQILRLIAQVEDVISFRDLANQSNPPLAKISMAYAVALQFAGAKVTGDEVYEASFGGDAAATIANAVSGLLSMMIPPEKLQLPSDTDDETEKKPKRRRKS